jgi:hypothetical protein
MSGDARVAKRLLFVEKAINQSALPTPSTIKAIG